MQLPDEAISYEYQSLLFSPLEEWTPAAELRAKHYLHPEELKNFMPRLLQVRSQVAADREIQQPPPELQPLDAGFIDLPQKLLVEHRKKNEHSLLGRILARAQTLRDEVDTVVLLGIGGSNLGTRALFETLKSAYHNELSPEVRLNAPRFYFAGDNVDNDALIELMEFLQASCIDPEIRDERWATIVVSKSGGTLETMAAFRALRKEAADFYGLHSPRLGGLVTAITGSTGKLRKWCERERIGDDAIFPIPDNIGGRFSVFTPVGLLPAAILNLDVRALLLGAEAMTRRFLEEPFEQNPVLQYAAVNYLLHTRHDKPTRVLAIWSKKLETVGHWYDQLLSESLGKQGKGPTPITAVQTRDLHSRGQQHQDGARDKMINNLYVKTPKNPPVMLGMAENDEDRLNRFSRKGLPDLMDAAFRGVGIAYDEVARPTADIIMPVLSEHTLGQLMQMLMLATVMEGRLMGVNPYGQPGVEAYKRNMTELLGEES